MLIKHYFKASNSGSFKILILTFPVLNSFAYRIFQMPGKKLTSKIMASSFIRNFYFTMTRKMKPYCKVREREISDYKVSMYRVTVVTLVLPSIINRTHRNSHSYKIRLCVLHRNIIQTNSFRVLAWECHAHCIFVILYPCPIYSCWHVEAKSKYGKRVKGEVLEIKFKMKAEGLLY